MLTLKPHPALLIVDMQNDFCHHSGTFAKMGMDISNMNAVILPIKKLLDLFRSQHRPVLFTRLALKEDYSDAGLAVERMPEVAELKGFIRGTWDYEIVDELKPKEDEVGKDIFVVDKTRTNGFYGTDLAARLRGLGVEQLVVCGVGTNVCVESTVREALSHDFYVIVPREATATLTKEMQQASLVNMGWFGEVSSLDEVVEALGSRDKAEKKV